MFKRKKNWDSQYFTDCDKYFNGQGIYVLEFEGGGIKIGMSSEINKRLKEYNKRWMRPIINAKYYRHSNARDFERLLIKQFADYTPDMYSNEYFVIPFQNVIEFIETHPDYRKPKLPINWDKLWE